MTAQEYLQSKGFKPGAFAETEDGKQFVLSILLNDFHDIASGQKIDVDKKFENLTEKYEAEKTKTK